MVNVGCAMVNVGCAMVKDRLVMKQRMYPDKQQMCFDRGKIENISLLQEYIFITRIYLYYENMSLLHIVYNVPS